MTFMGLASSLALILAAGSVSPAAAIVDGGIANEPNPYPFVGRITYVSPGPTGAYCTATLIDPSWALTAGHCLRIDGKDLAADTVRIRFNFTRLDGNYAPLGGEERSGAYLAYASTGMGVVKLDAPITDISPVPLADPNQSFLWAKGSDVEIVGWGALNLKGTVVSRELRDGWNTIDDDNVSQLGADSNMIRTTPPVHGGLGNAYGSEGDSGAPLLAYKDGFVEIGIYDLNVRWIAGRIYGSSLWDAVGRSTYHDWIQWQMANR